MKNYYKFKIETLNKENETIDTLECKTKRDVKRVLSNWTVTHYRTIKTKNNKIIKNLSKLNKTEQFSF